MKRYRERMSGACLLLRRKEFFNLAELLENVQLPRAIERFINQKAAIVGGPYIILMAIFAYNSQGPLPSWPNSLSLISLGVAILVCSRHSNFLQDLLQSPENERFFYRSKNPSTTDQERLKMNVLRWTIDELRRR